MKNWFEVDPKGLAQLRANMPKSALVYELISNAFDADGTTEVEVELEPVAKMARGKGAYQFTVTDNSTEGWNDLSHAYTLFAPSQRKGDATKRGRFNLGEKLVLALCRDATIETTKGTIYFSKDGRSFDAKGKRTAGTRFSATIAMTKAEAEEIEAGVKRVIPPKGIALYFNDCRAGIPTSFNTVEVTLPTVGMREDGSLYPTRRKTIIEISTPIEGSAMIYELGIPVVEIGDRYNVNVQQKVPLTMDRTNVTPAFLKEVRAAVAEAMVDEITAEDANADWVRTAAASPDASEELTAKVFKERFGLKALIFDPSDLEANNRAVAAGHTLVHGRSMSSAEWANVREHGVALPAGKLFPTHPGTPTAFELIPLEQYTLRMKECAAYALRWGKALLGLGIGVRFIREPNCPHAASYGARCITFNVAKLKGWLVLGMSEQWLDLFIHELAHEIEANHLSDKYHEACTSLGAKAAFLAAKDPSLVGA